jgi:hypothetical protein
MKPIVGAYLLSPKSLRINRVVSPTSRAEDDAPIESARDFDDVSRGLNTVRSSVTNPAFGGTLNSDSARALCDGLGSLTAAPLIGREVARCGCPRSLAYE